MSHWRETALARRLGLSAPIVQGPFGSGLSAVDLVVAVSESGGLGSFGVHHLHRDGIRDVAAAIRARTQRPFALNLWIPFENSEHPQVSDAEFDRAVDLLSRYFDELNVPRPKLLSLKIEGLHDALAGHHVYRLAVGHRRR